MSFNNLKNLLRRAVGGTGEGVEVEGSPKSLSQIVGHDSLVGLEINSVWTIVKIYIYL